jgi:glycine cleavage system H protein
MTEIPKELRYTKDHEWARTLSGEQGTVVEVGVTAYAVEQLGDVTLVDLPAVGTKLKAHDRFGDIESVKTVSELFAPVGGEVLAINENLRDKPELVNDNSYVDGWMVRIKVANTTEVDALMDATQYQAYLGSLDH